MFYTLNELRKLVPYKPGPGIRRVHSAYESAETSPVHAHEDSAPTSPLLENPRQKQMLKAYEEQLEESATSHPLTVEAIMSRPAVCLSESIAIKEAISTMEKSGFRNFPVTSGEGRLVGIVSDRDLLSSAKAIVRDVMWKEVISVSPQAPLRQLVAILLQEKLPCVPVVDANQMVVGIVTTTDILKTLLTHPSVQVWR